MPVSFGFSIGDFIAVIGAFKALCAALKDYGGAATEYQEVSNELDRIRVIVEKLNNICSDSTMNSNEVIELSKALAEQAKAYLGLVAGFNQRMNKYNHTLGVGAPQGSMRGTRSKADWALFFSSELKEFRLKIGTHASNITLSFCQLFYLHSLASKASLTKQQDQVQKSVDNGFAAIREKLDTLDTNQAALRNENTVVLQSLNDFAAEIVAMENHWHGNLKQEMASVYADITNRLSILGSKLDRLLEGRQRNSIPISSGAEISLRIHSRDAQSIEHAMSSNSEDLQVNQNGEAGRQLTEAELHAILQTRARKNPQKLHWDSSIVDFMKLLDLQSGLYARDLLAQLLDVNEGPRGSAVQNMALHRALMRELAQNEGRVPRNIYDQLYL